MRKVIAKSTVKTVYVALVILMTSVTLISQDRVYDIVVDKDLKPEILFKKVNYIKDPYLKQYSGTWSSNDYALIISIEEKSHEKGVYIDKGTGVLKVKSVLGNEIALGFNLISSTISKALGTFYDLEKYLLTVERSSTHETRLIVKFKRREVIKINDNSSQHEINLPSEIVLTKRAN